MTTHKVRVSLALIAVIGLSISACANDDPTASPVSLARDSAGILIVENGTPASVGVPEWTLSATPRVVIGESGGEPGQFLNQVVSAFRLADGRIVVGDRGSREVRFFDEAGRHLRSVGGQGEGPGEFRALVAVDRLPGDTVIAGAWPLGLRIWWDADGEYITNTQSGRWGPGLIGGRTLPDGTFLIDTYEGGSFGNSLELWAARGEESTFRTEGVLLRVGRGGESRDTIGTVFGEEWFKIGELGPNRSFAMHARPFTYRTHMAFTHDRILLGESHRGEVRAYALDGSLVQIIRWEQEPKPVTAADRSGFHQGVLDGLSNPLRRPVFERWLSEVEFPESKPAFRGFLTDGRGRIWVQEWTTDGGVDRVLVFERDGTLSATLAPPRNARLMDVGEDYVLVVMTDELGVETVGLFEFAKS
jgi:hypothetical protein